LSLDFALCASAGRSTLSGRCAYLFISAGWGRWEPQWRSVQCAVPKGCRCRTSETRRFRLPCQRVATGERWVYQGGVHANALAPVGAGVRHATFFLVAGGASDRGTHASRAWMYVTAPGPAGTSGSTVKSSPGAAGHDVEIKPDLTRPATPGPTV